MQIIFVATFFISNHRYFSLRYRLCGLFFVETFYISTNIYYLQY